MKVLVTGAQGYIGSRLIQMMIEEGKYDVEGWDIGFFKECKIEPTVTIDSYIKHIDCRDIDEASVQADAIVHLAAVSNDPLDSINENQIYHPTLTYAAKLAEIAKNKNIKFIFLSSCSVYGAATQGNLNEESPTNPQTGYSRNKLDIEKILAEISDDNFMPVALRFATVYGYSPRIRLDLFLNMFAAMAVTEKKILLNSNGRAQRPSLHIDDGCRTILKFLNDSDLRPGLNVYNVGNQTDNLEIIEAAYIVASMVQGTKVEVAAPDDIPDVFKDKKIEGGADKRSYDVSFDKLKNKFTESPIKLNVSTGLSKLIKQLQEANLNQSGIKEDKYYRLQFLQKLIKEKQITRDLRMSKL